MRITLPEPFVVVGPSAWPYEKSTYEAFCDAEAAARKLVEQGGGVAYVARICARLRRDGVVRDDVA